MILRTPFFERTNAANGTGLWTHWAGHLVAEKYQMSEKFEYFAVRNAASLYDTSPLYKYRIAGPDSERFLAGVLIRDVRSCPPGRAQYTAWCDGEGYLVEDGVVFRIGPEEFLLTAARPNLSYLSSLVTHESVNIEDVSRAYGALSLQGPHARQIITALDPSMTGLEYFHHAPAKLGGAAVLVSRTGFTGDLGYEIWLDPDDALQVWDTLIEAGAGRGLIPIGDTAVLMARIEAGLLLVDVDYEPSRFAFNDAHRSTPAEVGLQWMLGSLGDRRFVGREAIRREMVSGASRWRFTGLVVDWRDYDQRHRAAGLIAPKDHMPVTGDMMVYDPDGRRVGYATSFMYSPILQNHIALARVEPGLAEKGTDLQLEFTIDHRYQMVVARTAPLPLFDPPRKRS